MAEREGIVSRAGAGEPPRARSDGRRPQGARMCGALFAVLLVGTVVVPARAGTLQVPPETKEGLRLLFAGDADGAMGVARRIQQQQPQHPVGYLLEADVVWWQFYCEACEIKWNLIDAWKRGKIPADAHYLALADRAIHLAEASLRRGDSAEMRVYAGMAWALRARLHGLRDERLATARTGVRAREQFLRAIELDPALGDAYTGLGLYNYYADALSGFAKVLRFFLGIPGGSKKEGMRQLEVAMRTAELTREEARFYAAKCLRNYDQKYEGAIALLRPLVDEFPQNPIFHLLLGDLYAKLRRNEAAAASFHAARRAAGEASRCAARIQQVAQQALAALGPVATGAGE